MWWDVKLKNCTLIQFWEEMIFNETVASSKRLFRYSCFVRFPGGFCELAVLTDELDQKTVSLAIMSEFFLYVLRHILLPGIHMVFSLSWIRWGVCRWRPLGSHTKHSWRPMPFPARSQRWSVWLGSWRRRKSVFLRASYHLYFLALSRVAKLGLNLKILIM